MQSDDWRRVGQDPLDSHDKQGHPNLFPEASPGNFQVVDIEKKQKAIEKQIKRV